jgi:hypothetical protein
MPFMLRFHDTDDTTEMPDPAQVGHAAAWAAERGYWDVATCLMELAHALAELEAPTPAATFAEQRAAYEADPRYVYQAGRGGCLIHGADCKAAQNGRKCPGDPRYVDQAAPHPESRLTEALARAKPARWCAAPEELGGQQTCQINPPCPLSECEIGERIPFGALGPADRP